MNMDRLSPTPLTSLLSTCPIRSYAKGQIILYPDDQPKDLFAIQQGQVKLYDIDDQGNEKILHIIKAPAMFPLPYHFGQSAEVVWFYAALTDAQVYLVPYDMLTQHMKEDGVLSSYIISAICREMHELLVRIDSMSKTTAQAKLIAALKFLAVNHAHLRRNGWRHVAFSVSHQLLADISGVTRESITIAMQQLQQDRVIRYPKVTVLEIQFERLCNL
jgi:CRP/FNR family transcriptional regulator